MQLSCRVSAVLSMQICQATRVTGVQAGFEDTQFLRLPGGPAAIGPSLDPAIEVFILPLKNECVADTTGTSQTRFVPALVGQVVTMPTAVVYPARRQIELAHPSAAIDAVPAQRAEEPPADPAEVTGRRYERDLVVALGLFARGPVRVRVPKPDVAVAVKGTDGHADAGHLFAPMVRPSDNTGAETREVVMLSQKRHAHTVGLLDRVLLVPVVSPHRHSPPNCRNH